MSALLLLLGRVAAQTPEPTPTETEFTIYNVTPGIAGFIAFFVLAVVGWLLFRSMAKHVRRVDRRRVVEEHRTQSPDAGAGAPKAAAAVLRQPDDAAPGPDVAGDAAPGPDVAGDAAPAPDVAGDAAPAPDVAGDRDEERGPATP